MLSGPTNSKRRQTLRSGDDLQPLPSINLPSFITLNPPPPHPHPYLNLLPLYSLCPISPPPRPPPPCPVLSSSFPISLSSIPASSRQFQISAKAAVRRLDAYCCYRNRPSALDYNVTLSPRQGYNVCSFLCLTSYTLAYLLFVCTPVSQSMNMLSCHCYALHAILMSSIACSYAFKH